MTTLVKCKSWVFGPLMMWVELSIHSKSKAKLKLGEPAVRFALIVEIDTQGIEVDLYAEVEAAVVKINAVQAVAT